MKDSWEKFNIQNEKLKLVLQLNLGHFEEKWKILGLAAT